MSSPEYLTVEQVAERLHLNIQTVRKYIRENELKAAKLGKRYIVTSTELERFVNAQMK